MNLEILLLDAVEDEIRGRKSKGNDCITGVRQLKGTMQGPYRFLIQANGPTTVLLLDLDHVPASFRHGKMLPPNTLIVRVDGANLVVGIAWYNLNMVTFTSPLSRIDFAEPYVDVMERLADTLREAEIEIEL